MHDKQINLRREQRAAGGVMSCKTTIITAKLYILSRYDYAADNVSVKNRGART